MNAEWIDVEFVLADGTIRAGQAVDIGEGWCDCMMVDETHVARFWAKSNGTVDTPFNMVRLAKPIGDYSKPTPCPDVKETVQAVLAENVAKGVVDLDALKRMGMKIDT